MKSNTQNAKIEAITEKTLVLGIDVNPVFIRISIFCFILFSTDRFSPADLQWHAGYS